MVPRTRTGSKGKGKRRAISPASSICSNNTIGNEFVASLRKRIKSEPCEESEAFRESSAPGAAGKISENTSAAPTPAFAKRSRAPSRLSAASDIHREPDDREAVFDAPADLLHIFSTGSTATKKFQGRLEEVVDDAFKLATRSENDPPGLAYIEQIVETLERNGAAGERTVEVKTLLGQVWRHKMAEYLGKMITSSDELRDTLNAVVSALPFQPGHNGFLFCLPTNNQCQVCPAEPVKIQSTPDDRFPTTVQSTDEHLLRAPSPLRKAKRETSEGGTSVAASLHNNPSSRERPVPSFKERFPEPFDLVLHYVERHTLFTRGMHEDAHDEGERLRQQAKAIFDSMSSEERRRWRRIHKQILKGDNVDLDEAACRVLLAEQHTVDELSAETTSTRHQRAASNRKTEDDQVSMKSVMIPFVSKANVDTTRRVMIILNTPEMANIDTSPGHVTDACWEAFGHKSSLLQVEEWNEHIWIATFATFASANKVKGTTLNLHGVPVMVEHMYPKPPFVFVCDITDIDVTVDEIAFRIAKAFAKGAGRPMLRLQESRKLYRGRYLWISLPRGQKLVRFYIRMLQRDSGLVHVACFRPVNPLGPCALCEYQHGTRACESSRPIELPLLH